jgi:hypothetical protein
MLQAIEFGNARAMRTVGLKVEFDKQIELAELRKGKALSESEKVQIRYNAVMREAAKAQGAGAAAAHGAESQMKALSREVNDLKEQIGKEFQDPLAPPEDRPQRLGRQVILVAFVVASDTAGERLQCPRLVAVSDVVLEGVRLADVIADSRCRRFSGTLVPDHAGDPALLVPGPVSPVRRVPFAEPFAPESCPGRQDRMSTAGSSSCVAWFSQSPRGRRDGAA